MLGVNGLLKCGNPPNLTFLIPINVYEQHITIIGGFLNHLKPKLPIMGKNIKIAHFGPYLWASMAILNLDVVQNIFFSVCTMYIWVMYIFIWGFESILSTKIAIKGTKLQNIQFCP